MLNGGLKRSDEKCIFSTKDIQETRQEHVSSCTKNTTGRCPVCRYVFGLKTSVKERQAHINQCLDCDAKKECTANDEVLARALQEQSWSAQNETMSKCTVCLQDTFQMTVEEQKAHDSTCKKQHRGQMRQTKRQSNTRKLCPMCSKMQNNAKWSIHLKQCTAKTNTPVHQLLQMLWKSETANSAKRHGGKRTQKLDSPPKSLLTVNHVEAKEKLMERVKAMIKSNNALNNETTATAGQPVESAPSARLWSLTSLHQVPVPERFMNDLHPGITSRAEDDNAEMTTDDGMKNADICEGFIEEEDKTSDALWMLSDDFGTLLETGEMLSDFVFHCSNRTQVRAHKVVLAARTKPLKNMILDGLSEMQLLDFPSEVVRGVLYFIYTGRPVERHVHRAQAKALAERFELVGFTHNREQLPTDVDKIVSTFWCSQKNDKQMVGAQEEQTDDIIDSCFSDEEMEFIRDVFRVERRPSSRDDPILAEEVKKSSEENAKEASLGNDSTKDERDSFLERIFHDTHSFDNAEGVVVENPPTFNNRANTALFDTQPVMYNAEGVPIENPPIFNNRANTALFDTQPVMYNAEGVPIENPPIFNNRANTALFDTQPVVYNAEGVPIENPPIFNNRANTASFDTQPVMYNAEGVPIEYPPTPSHNKTAESNFSVPSLPISCFTPSLSEKSSEESVRKFHFVRHTPLLSLNKTKNTSKLRHNESILGSDDSLVGYVSNLSNDCPLDNSSQESPCLFTQNKPKSSTPYALPRQGVKNTGALSPDCSLLELSQREKREEGVLVVNSSDSDIEEVNLKRPSSTPKRGRRCTPKRKKSVSYSPVVVSSWLSKTTTKLDFVTKSSPRKLLKTPEAMKTRSANTVCKSFNQWEDDILLVNEGMVTCSPLSSARLVNDDFTRRDFPEPDNFSFYQDNMSFMDCTHTNMKVNADASLLKCPLREATTTESIEREVESSTNSKVNLKEVSADNISKARAENTEVMVSCSTPKHASFDDENACMSPKTSAGLAAKYKSFKAGCSVHPETREPITPMPDFSTLATPQLEDHMKRYALRKMTKGKMVAKMKEVYKYQHHFTEWEENAANLKKKKAEKVVEKKKGKKKKDEHVADINQKLMEFVQNNTNVYQAILVYEPLDFTNLHDSLKRQSIACSKKQLENFLDEQCICYFASKDEVRKPRGKNRVKAK